MEKQCQKCTRKAGHNLVDKWYCSKCFCTLIEQKIRHNLRRYGLSKGSKLLVTDKACAYIVSKVINIPVQIVNGKQKNDFTVLPWTMDDENEEFLQAMFSDSPIPEEDKKKIKLFLPVSKKDMKSYFTLKKSPYTARKTEINAMMDALEDKYAGTKSALLRSSEKIRQLK